MKRHVLLLVIDALTAPLFIAEMDNGRYPNMQKLREAGTLREQCISIFPSITHAALTSIATGKYPREHGVVASHWYDVDGEKVIYFSGNPDMVLQKGAGTFLREFLIDLNHTHLEAPTIFQTLEREGHETACVNFLIYRGDVAHEVEVPVLVKWLPDLPSNTTVQGPQQLLLGDLLANPAKLDIEAKFTGINYWFGFRDENSVDLMRQLAKTDEFPDFTLAYFPENDKHAHANGPKEAHKHLGHIDEMLGQIFAEYGGVDAFLQQFTIVITGDHSQSETAQEEADCAIDLEKLLADYQLAEAGQPWQEDDQIMPCPNLRAAQLYCKELSSKTLKDITAVLLKEPRIDQLMYRADLAGKERGYIVQTSEGKLHFWLDDNGTADRYGNEWSWQGDLHVVNGRVQDNVITFPNYPNAFERIAGVLDSPKSGQLWLTARVGHEFVVPHVKNNADGGSHASLHVEDSQTVLLAAGVPTSVTIPKFPRIVDIAPFCHACVIAEAA